MGTAEGGEEQGLRVWPGGRGGDGSVVRRGQARDGRERERMGVWPGKDRVTGGRERRGKECGQKRAGPGAGGRGDCNGAIE